MPIPTPRDAVSQGKDYEMRITLLERRLAFLSGGDTDWVELTPLVTLAPGLSWSTGGAIYGRKVGPQVQLQMDYVRTDAAGFFQVGTSGNVGNTVIISDLPEAFRPGRSASLSQGPTGRIVAFYATPGGTIVVPAVVPNSDWTGTTPFPAGESFSFSGMYFS